MMSLQSNKDSFNQIVLPSNISKNINLMQNSPVGLFQMSMSGYFNLANEEMKRIINVDGYDLYRTNIFSFLNKTSTQILKQVIKNPKRDDKFVFEFMVKNDNDTKFDYQVTITPEFHHDEFQKSWLGSITTFPHRKQPTPPASQSLEKLKKQYEKMKEQLAHLCHEVRIPVNAISGMSYLLNEKVDNKIKEEFLTPLFASADFLEKLVNSILDFSKMDGGNMELHKEEFSLNELLKDIQITFNMLLKDKPINFVIENNIKNDSIYGDSLRLKQILSNLANNACKFTSMGEIGIRTSLYHPTPDQPMIRFEVWDTGIGIPKDKLETIFEAYQQADSSTAGLYGGTGLGLSIVQLLVNLHEGKVNIKSTVDKGTTFIVDLPYETNTSPIIEEEEPSIHDSSLIQEKKILVFEDDYMTIRLMQNILNIWGCEFKIFKNGLVNPQEIMKENFDLILMDINMPGRNGYDLTRAFRQQGFDIPIIALTGSVFKEEKQQAIDAGMNDYIEKPFSFPDLEKAVIKWLLVK